MDCHFKHVSAEAEAFIKVVKGDEKDCKTKTNRINTHYAKSCYDMMHKGECIAFANGECEFEHSCPHCAQSIGKQGVCTRKCTRRSCPAASDDGICHFAGPHDAGKVVIPLRKQLREMRKVREMRELREVREMRKMRELHDAIPISWKYRICYTCGNKNGDVGICDKPCKEYVATGKCQYMGRCHERHLGVRD
jgi:hypothetical protein